MFTSGHVRFPLVAALVIGGLTRPVPVRGQGLFGLGEAGPAPSLLVAATLPAGALAVQGKPALDASGARSTFTTGSGVELPRRGAFDPRKDMPDLANGTIPGTDGAICWGMSRATLVHWMETMQGGDRRDGSLPDRSRLGSRADLQALDHLVPLRPQGRERGVEDFRLMRVTDGRDRNPTPERFYQVLAGQWHDNQDVQGPRYEGFTAAERYAQIQEALRTQGLAQVSFRGEYSEEEKQEGKTGTWGHSVLVYRGVSGKLRTAEGTELDAVALLFADPNKLYRPGGPVRDQDVQATRFVWIPSLERFHYQGSWASLINTEQGTMPTERLGVMPLYSVSDRPSRSLHDAPAGGDFRNHVWVR